MRATVFAYDPSEPVEARVDRLRAALDGLDGLTLVQTLLLGRFAGRIALVSSFGAESAVLLDLIARVDPATPVLFLDTQKLFPETLAYRDTLVDRLGLKDVRTLQPDPHDIDRHDPDGSLWSYEPDLCCHIRKTEPLALALEAFDGWITGRKRFHGGRRGALPTIELDGATNKIKVNPLAPWTPDDIQRYLAERDLPAHPLVKDGFLSIGCVPCTRPVKPGESPRAGRWAWLDKTECGIHGEGI